MRKFKLGLVALAATAAVAVPATSAMAGTDSAATSATASGGCLALCEFSILDNNNVEILKDIDVTNVLNVCPNISLVQVTALAVGQVAVCDAANGTKVKKNW